MTLLELHDAETAALTIMALANNGDRYVRPRFVVDQYYVLVDDIGRRYSPELWATSNPLDRRS